jgi:hypothetical protein
MPVVLLLTAPSVIAGGLAVVLMNLRSASRVQLWLTTDHVSFRTAGDAPSQILGPVTLHAITFANYSRFEVSPDGAEAADSGAFSESDEAGERAWKPVNVRPPVIIAAGQASLQPSITAEPAGKRDFAATVGTLDKVWVRPGAQVTLETTDPSSLRAAIRLTGQSTRVVLTLPDTFQLFSDYGNVSGMETNKTQGDSQAFRLHLPSSTPQAEITGTASSLALFLTLPQGKPAALFSPDGVAVDAIEVTRQGPLGKLESSITGKSEITFPDDPKADVITLNTADFVVLGALKRFRIEKIAVDPATHSVQLIAGGTAGVLRTGKEGFVQDRRITYFDRLWHNPQLILLFSIVVWVFPTTVAGYKLYKEVSA